MQQETKLILNRLWDELPPGVRQIFHRHSLRVGYLAYYLGLQLGIEDARLTTGAFLHDIGKAGLSHEILLKPGPLTEVERLLVQSHPHIGNWICHNFLEDAKTAEFVRDHHERWDGKGYPRGLKGEEISLAGRIIAVCDVFDTLVFEERPYRPRRWTVPEALAELHRCSWTQFDGNVVNEFNSMLLGWPDLNRSVEAFEKEYFSHRAPVPGTGKNFTKKSE